MKRPVLKHLRIPKYDSDLSAAVKCVEGLTLSLVKTKYNDGNWEAISLRGYSKDPNNILKPGVLKSEETASEFNVKHARPCAREPEQTKMGCAHISRRISYVHSIFDLTSSAGACS